MNFWIEKNEGKEKEAIFLITKIIIQVYVHISQHLLPLHSVDVI